ncbi:MAG: TauD/TfdA family dioxygenase [Pseudonocardiaceae bacterium]
MSMIGDPAAVMVPEAVASELARVCTLEMKGHRWSRVNVDTARRMLANQGQGVLGVLAERVARAQVSDPGWAVLTLPDELMDEELQRAAAGVLTALGWPFYSIEQGGRLWIGQESSPAADPASFGGLGANPLHIDAPNVERVPDYTSLLVLRSDPAEGGASLLGDLRAALARITDSDRAELRRPVYFEGRAQGLHGVGRARLPFPVLEDADDGRWIRWAGKMLHDHRNTGHLCALQRFAAALSSVTQTVMLRRGQLLIADQQRIAHGRRALGDQTGLATGTRRWLVQTKTTWEPSVPAQTPCFEGGSDG